MELDGATKRNLYEYGGGLLVAVLILCLKYARGWIDKLRSRPTYTVGSIRNNALIDIAINTSVARLQEAVSATRAGVCEVSNGKVDATRFHELKFTAAYGYCAKGKSSIRQLYQGTSFRDYPELILAVTGDSQITTLCSKTVDHSSRLWQEMVAADIECAIICRIHVSDRNKLTHFVIVTFDECAGTCRIENTDVIQRITEAADEIAVELRRREK